MDLRRSVSVEDEPSLEMEALDPTAEDLKVEDADYVLQAGDVIDLSIFELMVPGQPWVEMRQISQEGFVTLPQVRQDILVAGKSARTLEKYLKKVLQDEQVLTEPDVTVLVREARNMTYNIMGAIAGPGSNVIPRPNFRLMDALAASGGVTPQGGPMQPLVKVVYVFRNEEGVEPMATTCPAEPVEGQPLQFAAVDDGQAKDGGHWIYVDGEWKFEKEGAVAATTQPQAQTQPTTQAVVNACPAKQATVCPEAVEAVEAGDEWEAAVAMVPHQRVLSIPLGKLTAGDPRYNVVIRNGDTIWVPPVMQGEFYIMGNVNRPGTFSLTGREITIRQAVAAAGGLNALADPGRAELIRRIGDNQEQMLAINIDRIFAGKEPDIILKPNDVLNVGTNPVMPFLAVLRNAFRFTYGFGFVYDRNFADVDSYSQKINPDTLELQQKAQLGF
jgi:protein involved in polysaccharide export with SLBB domain